jgi:hypothetical protein
MPVSIDDCEEPVEPDVIPIILAKFQFGGNGVVAEETHTINVDIEYAEFMQMMYSRTGDFVFRPCMHEVYDFLLTTYLQTHSITSCVKTEFAREDRTRTMSDLLVSRDLHNLINGPFTAVIDITVMSSILQFGIKQRVVFTVTSAPYKHVLKICKSHVYQIIIEGDEQCCCDC